jgi:hypothetical protein
VLRSRTRIFHPSVSQICPTLCLDRLGALSADQTAPKRHERRIAIGPLPDRLDNTGNLVRFNGAASPRFGQNLALRDSGSGPKRPKRYEHLNLDVGIPTISTDHSPQQTFIRRMPTLSAAAVLSSDFRTRMSKRPLCPGGFPQLFAAHCSPAHGLCRYVLPIPDHKWAKICSVAPLTMNFRP